ncbi:hypothetical protein ACYZTM_19635 [Pseudomonas sp. MDT2-39-1]
MKVSGELLALVRQMMRFKRRLGRTYGDTVWTELGDGSHAARIEDFTITLVLGNCKDLPICLHST